MPPDKPIAPTIFPSIVIGKPMSFAEDADYNETTTQLRERVSEMWEKI